MIKKLLLTLSFIALATIAFSGTTYAAQEGETIVITEELTKLINLYKEGVITCLLYTSPSPRDRTRSRMPSSA